MRGHCFTISDDRGVRTLERCGVPGSIEMAKIGHKTESIYRWYAIVDEQMHRAAAILT